MSALKELQHLFWDAKQEPQSAALLIASPENRRYLTGFASSDGYVAVCRDSAVFFTDSRYIEAAQNTVRVMPVCEQLDIAEQLTDFFREQHIEKVHIESGRMSVREYEKLKKSLPGVSIEADGQLDDCLDALRCVKTPEEVECILTAQRIAENAFTHILGFIDTEKTEKQIALELDFYMLSHGAEALSFETIAVSGENTSLPHGVPGERKIQKGDFVTMDFGAVYRGMHSDMTRTVAVGFVSDRQKEVYQTVLDAKNTAESIIREGLPARDADFAARSLIAEKGFGDYFRHGTGHGVGLEIHEFPNLSPKSGYTLREGNIVTVEPGIYLPGQFGVRVEDMVLVQKDGFRKLTEAPEELILL